jgi:hypothetical protein
LFENRYGHLTAASYDVLSGVSFICGLSGMFEERTMRVGSIPRVYIQCAEDKAIPKTQRDGRCTGAKQRKTPLAAAFSSVGRAR